MSEFTDEQLRRIDDIVERANRAPTTRLEQLHVQLSELLVAVAMIDDGTEYGREFRKLAREEEDHSEKARRFRKIASSGNPLNPTLYIDTMMAELYSALRQAPKRGDPIQVPSARAHVRASLAKRSIQDIQSAARRLALFHQSQVLRGRRTKIELDTLTEELAEIFAMATGFEHYRHFLPHSEDSHFVQFCHEVLAPHIAPAEATLKALSRRWKRLKDDASRPGEPVKRAPKRRLRPKKLPKATVA